MYEKYTDDIIGLIVAVAGTGFAGYVTYITGEIPGFFSMAFGVIMTFHFSRDKGGEK